MRIVFLVLGVPITMVISFGAHADVETGNNVHVESGKNGLCYAKSIPTHTIDPWEGLRQQGRTDVYRVIPEEDLLVHTYDWFSNSLYVSCAASGEITVIRLGPWHRGKKPRSDDLAIAFYKDGELLKRYNVLDITTSVDTTNGHYGAYQIYPVLASSHVCAINNDGQFLKFDMEGNPMPERHFSWWSKFTHYLDYQQYRGNFWIHC